MVVSHIELIESGLNGITSSNIEDEANLLRENDWLVLHPEANQDYYPVGILQDVSSGSGSSSSSSSFSESSENSDDQNEIDNEDDVTSSLAVGPMDQSDLEDDEQIDSIPSVANGHGKVSQGQTSGSQTLSPTHGSVVENTSPMHKPAVQVMERDGDYDPDRIPLGVFSRCNSLTPVDWSAESTDTGSLFSLHVGNTSLGRDRNGSSNAQLRKSGEISKRVELPLSSPSSSPSPLTVAQSGEKDAVGAKALTKSVEAVNKTKKDMGKTYPVDQERVKAPLPVAAPRPHSSLSRQPQSDGNEGSSRSFAFPRWLRSKFGGCSWSFCYSWNSRLNSTIPILAPAAQQHQHRLPIEAEYSVMTTDNVPHTKSSSCCYCFSCRSCFSCGSCRSCKSCCSFPSCRPCSSCCSLRSCRPCGSCCSISFCKRRGFCCSVRSCRLCSSCGSFSTCTPCRSCSSCGSCSFCYSWRLGSRCSSRWPHSCFTCC